MGRTRPVLNTKLAMVVARIVDQVAHIMINILSHSRLTSGLNGSGSLHFQLTQIPTQTALMTQTAPKRAKGVRL